LDQAKKILDNQNLQKQAQSDALAQRAELGQKDYIHNIKRHRLFFSGSSGVLVPIQKMDFPGAMEIASHLLKSLEQSHLKLPDRLAI
jgi:hypothetical protein